MKFYLSQAILALVAVNAVKMGSHLAESHQHQDSLSRPDPSTLIAYRASNAYDKEYVQEDDDSASDSQSGSEPEKNTVEETKCPCRSWNTDCK